MDLVQEDQREVIFSEREEDLKKLSKPLDCTCFRTSIWDETLYKAWSSIVYMLIPNVKDMESSLNEFAEILDADEVPLTLQMKNAPPHQSKYLGPALRESNLSSDLARPAAPAQGCP